jgi:hypothetical protein
LIVSRTLAHMHLVGFLGDYVEGGQSLLRNAEEVG